MQIKHMSWGQTCAWIGEGDLSSQWNPQQNEVKSMISVDLLTKWRGLDLSAQWISKKWKSLI